jgi:hypothetical protein
LPWVWRRAPSPCCSWKRMRHVSLTFNSPFERASPLTAGELSHTHSSKNPARHVQGCLGYYTVAGFDSRQSDERLWGSCRILSSGCPPVCFQLHIHVSGNFSKISDIPFYLGRRSPQTTEIESKSLKPFSGKSELFGKRAPKRPIFFKLQCPHSRATDL